MVKLTFRNIFLLLGSGFLIILILAFAGVDVSKKLPFGGMIFCVIIFLSTIGKIISSRKWKENENK